jgi:hypothetical protein
MKPLVESSRSNASQKMLKNHAKRSFEERWDMHRKADLKESKDNSKFPFG